MRNFKLSHIEDTLFFKDNFIINSYIKKSNGFSKNYKREISLLYLSSKVADLFAFARLWKFRDRGISFLIRAESFFSLPWESSQFSHAEHNGASKQNLKVALLVRVFSLSVFYFLLKGIFLFLCRIEGRRNSAFLKSFRFAILPYEGRLDGTFDLLVEICRLNSVKTFAIQSNWDNLSSKNFIYASPDYFGVWGKQSESHLMAFQRKYSIPTVLLGNPRRNHLIDFSETNQPKQAKGESNNNENVVIFAGHGAGNSDSYILRAVVDARSELGLDFKIKYRPHPFARAKIDSEGLRLLELQKIDVINEVNPADNKYFMEQLQSSSLLISQMSTLSIEALELGVPVCIPTFSNSKSDFSFEQAVNSLPHYSGVLLIPGIRVANNRFDLAAQINHSLLENQLIGSVDWICSRVNFADALIAKLEAIFFNASKTS